VFTDARHPMTRLPGLVLVLLALLLATSVRAEPVLPLQTWQTGNGAQVLFYPSDSLPMVDARITFDAGSARDPADKGGTASLTADLLGEGTTQRGAKAIADGFARVGAQFSASANLESATVQLRSLNQPDWLWPAVELSGEVISHPAFDAEDFERERDRQLRGIESRKQSASAVAQDTLRKAAFGDHPYAHPTEGTADSVERIEHADVRDFHTSHYVASNATVVIVGDLDQADARRLAKTLTADLPTGKPPAPLPEVPEIAESRTLQVDFPSEQSTVLVAHDGIPRKHDDYLPLYVGNHILGGSGFASRLMSELREKRGLAYSTYSYLMPLRAGGRFVMGIQTRNDQVEKALDLMGEELRRFIDEGPTDEELEDSQANLIGGFPMRLDSNAKISEQIAALAFLDLPLDYFDTYTQRVAAVEADGVRQAFERHVDPERRIVVIVGPNGDDGETSDGQDDGN